MTMPAMGSNVFKFVLGGVDVGYVKKVGGGTPKAASTKMQGGPINRAWHVQGNLSYEDVKATILCGQSKGFVDMMNLTLDDQPKSAEGIIHACTVDFKSKAQMELIGAWIKKLSFNKLDANSGDPFFVDCEFAVQSCLYKKGDDSKVTGKGINKADQWRCNAFSVEMGNMPCDHIVTCELPTVEQKFKELRVGKRRGYEWIPSVVELGKLKLQFPVSHGWEQWSTLAHAYIARGQMGRSQLMQGAVTMYAPDQETELGEFVLKDCALESLTMDEGEGGKDAIKMATAELSVTDIDLVLKVSDA